MKTIFTFLVLSCLVAGVAHVSVAHAASEDQRRMNQIYDNLIKSYQKRDSDNRWIMEQRRR